MLGNMGVSATTPRYAASKRVKPYQDFTNFLHNLSGI